MASWAALAENSLFYFQFYLILHLHASWVAIVIPTDRPQSVRNRCVIEVFVALFVLSFCPFDISVGVWAFVIGLSQISSFFFYIQSWMQYGVGKNELSNIKAYIFQNLSLSMFLSLRHKSGRGVVHCFQDSLGDDVEHHVLPEAIVRRHWFAGYWYDVNIQFHLV